MPAAAPGLPRAGTLDNERCDFAESPSDENATGIDAKQI